MTSQSVSKSPDRIADYATEQNRIRENLRTVNQASQYTPLAVGAGPVSKASGTLQHGVNVDLFTVAGGEVLITGLWLKCTTTMAGANTLAVTNVTTTGDDPVIVTATVECGSPAIGVWTGTLKVWPAAKGVPRVRLSYSRVGTVGTKPLVA